VNKLVRDAKSASKDSQLKNANSLRLKSLRTLGPH